MVTIQRTEERQEPRNMFVETVVYRALGATKGTRGEVSELARRKFKYHRELPLMVLRRSQRERTRIAGDRHAKAWDGEITSGSTSSLTEENARYTKQ